MQRGADNPHDLILWRIRSASGITLRNCTELVWLAAAKCCAHAVAQVRSWRLDTNETMNLGDAGGHRVEGVAAC